MFSFLQFISSAFMGAASDIYGRKTILLLSLVTGTYFCWTLTYCLIMTGTYTLTKRLEL